MQGDAKTAGDEYTRKALEYLTKGFGVVAKDRSSVITPGIKKHSLFAITNVLFKIYFKVNTLQLCGKLINVIDASGCMQQLNAFPVCDVVTYMYYLGRLKLFEDKYEEARYAFCFVGNSVCDHFVDRNCLQRALKHTPVSHGTNRQKILVNLTAVQVSDDVQFLVVVVTEA